MRCSPPGIVSSIEVVPNVKLKNVLTFALSTSADQSQGGSVELCISTKRNKVQVYRLDRVSLNLICEIPTQDPLLAIVGRRC